MSASSIPASVTADRVYRNGRFEQGLVLELDDAGRIRSLGPGTDAELRLEGRALLPGFVNGHSHAFQRALRGRTGRHPVGSDDGFWTWREAMYRLVTRLTPDDVYTGSLMAFREMAAAGYTTVGEFHYLHGDPRGESYDDPNVLARRVIDAALDAGLRVVLLNVFYERGGLRDEPLGPAQRRFAGGDPGEFCERTRALAAACDGRERVTVGLAAHSVRAVTAASLNAVADAARQQGWPLHIHLSEQLAEVRECQEVYGLRPVELAAEHGVLGRGTTGIHCTHLSEREIELLADSGSTVCACPTTEADLGDGFIPARELRDAGVPICLGSDSQVRIDPFEEMRAIEYHERLRHRRRNVLVGDEAGAENSLGVAGELLGFGTARGAQALGVAAGELAPGRWADFVAVDLGHPLLAGWAEADLATSIALSGDPRIVSEVYVGGRRVVPAA